MTCNTSHDNLKPRQFIKMKQQGNLERSWHCIINSVVIVTESVCAIPMSRFVLYSLTFFPKQKLCTAMILFRIAIQQSKKYVILSYLYACALLEHKQTLRIQVNIKILTFSTDHNLYLVSCNLFPFDDLNLDTNPLS